MAGALFFRTGIVTFERRIKGHRIRDYKDCFVLLWNLFFFFAGIMTFERPRETKITQPASNLGPLSPHQQNAIQWRFVDRPIVASFYVLIGYKDCFVLLWNLFFFFAGIMTFERPRDTKKTQPASNLGPLSAHQQNTIQWRFVGRPIVAPFYVLIGYKDCFVLLWNCLFFLQELWPMKDHRRHKENPASIQSWATIGPSTKHHSMAFCWQADSGPILCAYWV